MAERSLTLTRTNLELSERSPTLHLRLKKVKNSKKVKWTNDTVDNEGLNRKKSKCCCIYEKPRSFGESSSEEDNEECNSCHGHKSQCYRTKDPTGTELEESRSAQGENYSHKDNHSKDGKDNKDNDNNNYGAGGKSLT
ncbi:E3 ubiquitin-protein ligase PPP1R11 isoform X1 [Octopus bimaculoides]|uniref:E3 ubiquitin-protein ligase PPP1R11 n=1 Tax=Octopus bimaculoides TaxID=37653 RepID=A0A0L8H8V0_OCTBM|nr:E3 ubiquitin-protein ligase PPP1R11 isoform X1 [Octopus bimaculoides]|eukprot:XP_014774440.1 PREDICTED: protein phosphatase 1 regulatory subunit 11-like isoform X1 [Octopus bimaculoides]